jgi:divalent metal cation (Fe/Co/Zn/Cd) transporter
VAQRRLQLLVEPDRRHLPQPPGARAVRLPCILARLVREAPSDVIHAARLSALTVAWNTVVGGAAVAAVSTGSLSLIGFGINAVVDSSVSILLVWRFHAEDRGHVERAERAEARAERMAGVAFCLIAIYLAVQSIRALADAGTFESTTFGIVEAGASLLALPFIARAKYVLAVRIGSRALRADSILSASGVALAAVALAALVLDRDFAWWWADPAGGLVIAAILAWQGWLTLVRGDQQASSTSAAG